MATCERCGNDYDKAFQIVMAGVTHVFDCFECAIEAVAPRCAVCKVHIIGHGVEVEGKFYCCAHCASAGAGPAGDEVVDRVDVRRGGAAAKGVRR